MPRSRGPRYPFEPLEMFVLARLELRHVRYTVGLGTRGPHATDEDEGLNERIAQYLGISVQNLIGYRRRDLGPWIADRLACSAGVHPCSIWPEWGRWVPDDAPAVRAAALDRDRRRKRADRAFASLRAVPA